MGRISSNSSTGSLCTAVRVVAAGDGLSGCLALFAGARTDPAALFKTVADRPILTIGETDQFLQAGGIIVLKVLERRVRFEVDTSHAQKAGLRISAQLLALAAVVRGGGQ